jgi:hypothetical protein
VRWRYGDQLDWRLVLIGLAEDARQYAERGFTPLRQAHSAVSFRRYGMPFSPQPKSRVAATARACRAIAAARIADPGSEWRALRALQLANFTTPMLLAGSNDPADAAAAEMRLLELVAAGRADRVGIGDGAIWALPARSAWMRTVLDAATQAPSRVRTAA